MADVWIGYSAMLDRWADGAGASWRFCYVASTEVQPPAACCGRAHARILLPPPFLHRSVLSRVHAAYMAAKERAERAEAALEVSEAALAQERDSTEAYKVTTRAGWWAPRHLLFEGLLQERRI